MKIQHILFAFGISLCLLSCSDGRYEPYKPSEWRYDKYSDSCILPGDDFYRFVCGKGIASEGSDHWAPLSIWSRQADDYGEQVFSDAGNPVECRRLKEYVKSCAGTKAGGGALEKKYRGGELLEMKRRFFKSYAVLYAGYSSLEEKIKQVENDVHSINEYRINGIVNNIDDWYRLFDVTPERKFYLSPERRVCIW